MVRVEVCNEQKAMRNTEREQERERRKERGKRYNVTASYDDDGTGEAQDLGGTLATETTGESEILGLTVRDKRVEVSLSSTMKGEKRARTYMVTRLAWMAAKLVSSNNETR